MFPPFETERLTFCAVGGLALVLGLTELLLGFLAPRLARRWPLVAAALLALAAGGLALGGAEAHWCLAPLALAGGYVALALSRLGWSEWLFGRAGWLARQARFQAALVVALGGALLANQMRLLDRELSPDDLEHPTPAAAPNLETVRAVRAFTDAGRAVPLWQPEAGAPTFTKDADMLGRANLHYRVIATAPAAPRTNCHGWVFTGGKYWVRGAAVAGIVKDNGYKVVSDPAEGDLAVFRNPKGEVTHTAVVHSISRDGVILLESKWGQAGRYIHTTEGHPYAGNAIFYYRSDRHGHLLRGIDTRVVARLRK